MDSRTRGKEHSEEHENKEVYKTLNELYERNVASKKEARRDSEESSLSHRRNREPITREAGSGSKTVGQSSSGFVRLDKLTPQVKRKDLPLFYKKRGRDRDSKKCGYRSL